MIDHLTTTILHCMTNAPNPEAGARLAASRVTDELRKAMTDRTLVQRLTEASYNARMEGPGMDLIGDAFGFQALTKRHQSMLIMDRRDIVEEAWDAVIGDES